jgi:hypothetical protein
VVTKGFVFSEAEVGHLKGKFLCGSGTKFPRVAGGSMPKTAIHHKIMRIRNITSGIDIKLSQAQRRVGEWKSHILLNYMGLKSRTSLISMKSASLLKRPTNSARNALLNKWPV